MSSRAISSGEPVRISAPLPFDGGANPTVRSLAAPPPTSEASRPRSAKPRLATGFFFAAMNLNLQDDTTLRVESTLEGFESITRAAALAASQRGLSLSPSTLENLRALDLPTDHLQKPPPTANEVR